MIMLLPRLMFQGFDDRIERIGLVAAVSSSERVVTFKLPPSWGVPNPHQADFIGPRFQPELTHEEKYGWDPDEARKEYGFGGRDGTPKFKGYFG